MITFFAILGMVALAALSYVAWIFYEGIKAFDQNG